MSDKDREYDVTDDQIAALEHLRENGDYTAEIAEELLKIVDEDQGK